jgi:hypothetical protein
MICSRAAVALLALLLWLVPGTQAQKKPPAKPADTAAENPLASFTHFSAVMNGGMGGDVNRKIYRSGDLVRLEFSDFFRIVSLHKSGTWSVHPDRCSYGAVADVGVYPWVAVRNYKVERSMSGEKETTDGHSCNIENASFTAPDGHIVVKMKFWEAEDLKGFPVRIDLDNGTGRWKTYTFTEVSLNTPDPALFKRPSKCGAMPLPGQKGVQERPLKMTPQAPTTSPKTPPQK